MRSILLALAFVTIFITGAAPARAELSLQTVGTPTIAATTYALQQPAPKDLNVDINVNRGGGSVWYRSPVWIAIGALAGVVLLVLIILAVRGSGTGGGTTIIRE